MPKKDNPSSTGPRGSSKQPPHSPRSTTSLEAHHENWLGDEENVRLLLESHFHIEGGILRGIHSLSKTEQILHEKLISLEKVSSFKLHVSQPFIDKAFEKAQLPLTIPTASLDHTTVDAKKDALRKRYPFLEILEVAPEKTESPLEAVAKLAADQFSKLWTEASVELSFGIGGGETMHHMVQQLTFPKDKAGPKIYPTCLAIRYPGVNVYDSPVNVVHALKQCNARSESYCFTSPLAVGDPLRVLGQHAREISNNPVLLESFQQCSISDIFFLGIGGRPHDIGRSFDGIYRAIGLKSRDITTNEPKTVGDINLSLFSSEGQDLTSELAKKQEEKLWQEHNIAPENRKSLLISPELLGLSAEDDMGDARLVRECHPFLLAFNIDFFSRVVKEKNKRVIAVVASTLKVDAVHALLTRKDPPINGLILDVETLNGLYGKLSKKAE